MWSIVLLLTGIKAAIFERISMDSASSSTSAAAGDASSDQANSVNLTVVSATVLGLVIIAYFRKYFMSRDTDNWGKCVVCLDERVCIKLDPCKHMPLCESCIGKVSRDGNKCPCCRVSITSYEKVFV